MGFILLAVTITNIKVLLLYLLIYTVVLLNIFGLLFIFIKNNNKSELNFLHQFIYIKKSNLILTFSFIISLFSLLGIPPLSGFFGKFFVFIFALNLKLYFLVFIGLLLSVISCFYYLRLIKIMSFNNTKN
jgi:NADH-quinone oxidoreductase subunit N